MTAIPADRPVSQRRLMSWMFVAAAAMYSGFQGIQQILIPAQIEAIDPASKIANLALVTTVSSVAAVIGLLAGGVISDRTHGRWGRRAPSLVFGVIVSAALMLAMGVTTALGPLLALYAALWFSANYYQGAFTAILPERVPVERRGVGSAVIALGTPIGIVLGVNVAARASVPVAYAFLAVFLLLATAGLVFFAREAPAAPRERPPPTPFGRRLLGFVASFRFPDFTLAFVGRAFMFFSFFSVSGYSFYILQDHIGVEHLHGMTVQVAISVLVSIQMLGCVISAALSGWLSDKVGRPKLLVWTTSIGLAVAFLIPVFSPTWMGMVVMQGLTGFLFGAYLSVDLALMSLVLPDRNAEGRDMAILEIGRAHV